MNQNNLMKCNSAVDEYISSAEQALETETTRYLVIFGVDKSFSQHSENQKTMFLMVLVKRTRKIDGVDGELRSQYTENMNRSKSF